MCIKSGFLFTGKEAEAFLDVGCRRIGFTVSLEKYCFAYIQQERHSPDIGGQSHIGEKVSEGYRIKRSPHKNSYERSVFCKSQRNLRRMSGVDFSFCRQTKFFRNRSARYPYIPASKSAPWRTCDKASAPILY